jgi:GH25 family lysozyme M1 (1,4-beta-N-acetylmuramidase)
VFTQWRDAGYQRVILKIGGGDAGRYADSCFAANRANAETAGLVVEGYWFNGTTDPAEDARFAHTLAPGMRIWFDVENEKFATHTMPHWTPTQLCAAARAAESLGHQVGCYMSSSVTHETDWADCVWMPLWVANYGARTCPNVGCWSAPVMWQYTSKGSLPGHAGYLDLSFDLIATASCGGTPIVDVLKPIPRSKHMMTVRDLETGTISTLVEGAPGYNFANMDEYNEWVDLVAMHNGLTPPEYRIPQPPDIRNLTDGQRGKVMLEVDTPKFVLLKRVFAGA